jgi:hypothetical protein
MKLASHEYIVTAWAEKGIGGARPVWVLIYDQREGRHRVDCLQYEEWTKPEGAALMVLYNLSEQMHGERTGNPALRRPSFQLTHYRQAGSLDLEAQGGLVIGLNLALELMRAAVRSLVGKQEGKR